MFVPNREELAWAAGLFDGEGWVGVASTRGVRRPSPVFGLGITQVDRRVLDRFCAAVGLGKVYEPYRSPDRTRPLYRYHLSHHPRVQAVCAMLWHWLSPVKRAQFVAALSHRVLPMPKHKRCAHGGYSSLCRECLREPNRLNMRRWRLVRKTAHALLAAV